MGKEQTKSLFPTEPEKEIQCHHIIRVAFESAVDSQFDYLLPDELWPIEVGQRVEVPFGKKNKLQIGFCVDITSRRPDPSTPLRSAQDDRRKLPSAQDDKRKLPSAQDDKRKLPSAQDDKKRGFKLKKVARVIDKEPLLGGEFMELARWISSYYVCPLGQVLAAMVPGAVKRSIGARTEKYIYLTHRNNKDLEKLRGAKQKKIVSALEQHKAFDTDSAVRMQETLENVHCGKEPVKRLVERQILKIAEKTVLKSLPAVPKGMSIHSGKVVLNEDQQMALKHINEKIDSGKFAVTLLHGVTDSGKTELYITAIKAILQKGKNAIVLLPEIALTAQTVQRFSVRFERIAVMHSGLTASQRNAQWQKIKSGDADVVIGARSAIFAPQNRLGLIIVDEEHEPSYKQDSPPRYHGRDVAIKRAQLENAYCILGSATPSLETLENCRNKGYFSLVRLPKRVMNLPMPEMKLIDLRKIWTWRVRSSEFGVRRQQIFNTKQRTTNYERRTLISEPLAEHLRQTLAKKEQAILLLNRRGYSTFIFCPSCRHTLHCSNCDVTLTFHKSDIAASSRGVQTVTGRHIGYGYAMCHYCLAQTLVPKKCPICGMNMTMIGMGSQRLEEELVKKFPQARVARIDSDSMTGKDYYSVLQSFSEGRINILAGTQMLAKGLHFPNVTLVGIINADTSLYIPDFRANERTFQLISQVAGRAGRSEKKGYVYVQTFLPDQPAIQFALKGDFEGFVREELRHRKACNLPPFWRLAAIIMRDRKYDKLEAASEAVKSEIASITKKEKLKAIIRGPMPAAISRLQRFHRMQIIIQAPDATIIRVLFEHLRTKLGHIRPAVTFAIDIDPVNLL